MYRKIIKIISDLTTLGPYRTGRALANRIGQKCRIPFMRRRVPHTGDLIVKRHGFGGTFDSFWGLKPRRSLTFLPLLLKSVPQAELLKKASFLIGRPLGQAYWMNNASTDQFFGDIRVEAAGMADIKDAWIRGRCHEVPLLAWAYCSTKDVRYRDQARQYMRDWIVHNRYLYGVHWVGPMEVAIRAANWIIGLSLMDADELVHAEPIVCSLYDHMTYLEQRFEWYDGRTNNHYLSDLVGYLYLCWFFYDLPGMSKKWTWCMREIEREWNWQIFDEGTSYEGSTQYHALVMELLFFAKELARDHGTPFDRAYENKFDRMATFYEWCRVNGRGERLVIGDDGSDLFLPILSRDVVSNSFLTCASASYSQFGLTILKQSEFHVSIRHAAYTSRQPSGHFHNDRESITIAYNGIPIIVDPGSYVYTRSPEWRNYFRSVAVHNTFFIEGREPGDLRAGLFVLPVTQDEADCIPHRRVIVENGSVIITDRWEIKKATQGMSCWNFTCAANIALQQTEKGWIFLRDGVALMRMESDLYFERYDGWVSQTYGIKNSTYGLRARSHLSSIEHTMCFFSYPVSPECSTQLTKMK